MPASAAPIAAWSGLTGYEPEATASLTLVITIGVVGVACSAACGSSVVTVTMTSAGLRTSSTASGTCELHGAHFQRGRSGDQKACYIVCFSLFLRLDAPTPS